MIQDQLEALATTLYLTLPILSSTGFFLGIYCFLYTPYWFIPVLYFIWAWYIDKETPERVGRPSQWLRSLSLFKYAGNYFPIKIHKVPGLCFDPNRNYLCCLFPHGFFPFGAVVGLLTTACDGHTIFPNHRVYGTTLKILFKVPVIREFMLGMGMCCASAEGIGYLLSRPAGGQAVGLVVGGTSEMAYCHGGQYRLTLKNRKGFAKLALKYGAPLVPVFTFGENSIFRQVFFQDGSLLSNILGWLRNVTGLPVLAVYGRGLFQNKFGLIPLKHPLNVVVGLPIEVSQIENPTQNDIDELHQKFVEKLTEIFEEYKYLFEKNPDNCKLILA